MAEIGRRLLLCTAFAGLIAVRSSRLWPDSESADARTDSGHDDFRGGEALQHQLDELEKGGGGELKLPPRSRIVARNGPIVGANVRLNLNGSTLVLKLSDGDATGVRLRSGATVENGRIVVESSGSPGIQGGIHAPVLIGALLGESDSPGGVSPFEGVRGWTVRDLVLEGDKNVDAGNGLRVGSPAIQVMGGTRDGLIEDIRVPDSATLMGGVHLDWGIVGPIASSNIPADAELYRAGRGYTTHPNNIIIRDIQIGRLSRPLTGAGGTFGIRLSGVHDVHISNVTIAMVTEAGFYHTAGDLGFEFARSDARARRCRGIVVENGRVADCGAAAIIRTDSFADNVGRAVAEGYRPLLPPIHETDIRFERIEGTTTASEPGFGVRVDHQNGGMIADCVARGFKRGFYIDEQVYGLTLVRPVAIGSMEAGISVEHPYRPPARIRIENPVASSNGRSGRAGLGCGVLVGRSDEVEIIGGRFAADTVQKCGVRITAQARGARLVGLSAGSVQKEN